MDHLMSGILLFTTIQEAVDYHRYSLRKLISNTTKNAKSIEFKICSLESFNEYLFFPFFKIFSDWF